MRTENTVAQLSAFHDGKNYSCYRQLGILFEKENNGKTTVVFRTFAPGSCVESVFLTGDFNGWGETHPMQKITDGGVFEARIPYTPTLPGTYYKYKIVTRDGKVLYKADPFAPFYEKSPKTASVVFRSEFDWSDGNYLENRKQRFEKYKNVPLCIYELHLGSFKRNNDGSFITYNDAAKELIPYLKQLGYTHIKLMPVAEHPFDGSLGYQTTGFFAPTSRFGNPDDFRSFVNECHKAGLGVIADIDISSFPKDEHGLFEFDGSHVYEYNDPSKREHKVNKTARFDFTKPEIISFVMSVLSFWTQELHLDGLYICGVRSVLYPDFDRTLSGKTAEKDAFSKEGASFLENMCKIFSEMHKDVLLISDFEENNFGFTHIFSTKPVQSFLNFRDACSDKTFCNENGLLTGISHDIPGICDTKDISRLVMTYITTMFCGKITFMGTEAANREPWVFFKELDWQKLFSDGVGQLLFTRDINALYLSHPVLWGNSGYVVPAECKTEKNGVFAYSVINAPGKAYKELLVVFNTSSMGYKDLAFKLPKKAECTEILSTNSSSYGGNGALNKDVIRGDDELLLKVDLEPRTARIFEVQ